MNITFLGRTNGIKALLIILLSIISSTTFSTTLVLKPVLCLSSLAVAPTFTNLVGLLGLSSGLFPKLSTDTIPLHVVSQAFQTVPIAFMFADNTASKLPSRLIITAGAVSVSNHSSPDGDNCILPIKLASR